MMSKLLTNIGPLATIIDDEINVKSKFVYFNILCFLTTIDVSPLVEYVNL